MKLPKPIHPWNVSPREAVEIQRRLADSVAVAPLSKDPRLVAGVDCAVSPRRGRCYCTVVIWDSVEARILEVRNASRPLEFPYLPGLLSFREIPVILDALALLETTPDLIVCDGQGFAHPRRFGLACHLGVVVSIPCCGCAKSRLVGTYEQPAPERGSSSPLFDRGELIGRVVRTRDGVKPVFVSVGHLVDLSGSVRAVLSTGGGYRLPEPTRQADRLVGEFKRSEEGWR